jgi:NTP pyrophosphatase (non-canonical NTP hydrolase)
MSAGPYSIGSKLWPGLSKLIEECGEVGQVAGKLIATGGVPAHWDGSNLRERLLEELADLRAAITFVAQVNQLGDDVMNARAQKKLDQFWAWHREQGSCCDNPSSHLVEPREGLGGRYGCNWCGCDKTFEKLSEVEAHQINDHGRAP